MDEVKRFVGIDVAKAALDVFVGSAGTAFTVTNDEVGIRDLVSQLVPADFVILEATGGLETPVASALAAAESQWRSLIHARCETLPVPPAGWPRPTGWMPKCWRGSVRRFDPRRGH